MLMNRVLRGTGRGRSGNDGWGGERSEIRNPKAERRPKSEIRRPNEGQDRRANCKTHLKTRKGHKRGAGSAYFFAISAFFAVNS
jgi:hypothetical protein